MTKGDARALGGLLLAIVVGLLIDLGPGALLWLFMHPISFWQRAACATGMLVIAGALAFPAFLVAAFITTLFLD